MSIETTHMRIEDTVLRKSQLRKIIEISFLSLETLLLLTLHVITYSNTAVDYDFKYVKVSISQKFLVKGSVIFCSCLDLECT